MGPAVGTLYTVYGSRCQWHDARHRLDCSPRDEWLRFSDADPRCWGRSWPLYLLGLKLRPSQRKRPTTTTAETKRGQHPAASASPGASGSGHYGHVFAEDWQAMQIAPSAVFPLGLLFSPLVCVASEDSGSLGWTSSAKKKKKKVEGEGPDLSTAGPPIG